MHDKRAAAYSMYLPESNKPSEEKQLKIIAFAVEACRKPPRYVPYKCTYGTFGASNQGQMLDVWQGEDSQIHHLIRQIRRFTISSSKKK